MPSAYFKNKQENEFLFMNKYALHKYATKIKWKKNTS